MTLTDYNAICASFPHATNFVQWGGVSVWKVGGKMFALGWPDKAGGLLVSFKCSPMSFEMLLEIEGCKTCALSFVFRHDVDTAHA